MQQTQIINRPVVKAGLLQLNLLQELHSLQEEAAELEEIFDWLIAEYGDVLNPKQAEQFHDKLQALLVTISAISIVAMTTHLHSGDGLIQRSFNTEGIGSTNHSTEQVLNSKVAQSKFKAPSIEPNSIQLNSTVSINALRRSIIGQESGGKFHLVNPHSGALGYAQVMPENVPTWTREALGTSLTPEEFLRSPELQLKTIDHKLNQYLTQQTIPERTTEEVVRRVASLWYSGKAKRWNDPKPQYYDGHPYPSIAQYTKSVWDKYSSQAVATPVNSKAAARVVAIAEGWVGKDFKPGESARCADFVRHILSQAGLSVSVSNQPIDKAVQWQGPYSLRAQSFFGEDVGTIIRDKSHLQPGDLVAWANTYGSFAPGAITHVGIYVGDGMIIDRSTRSMPIRKRSIDTFKNFVAGVRPYAY